MPTQAVSPVIPSTPRNALGETPGISGTGCSGVASEAIDPLLPADEALYELAHFVAGALGLDDPAESKTAHNLANANRRQVGRRVIDPRTVGGVKRDPLRADERLTLADLGKLLLVEFEGV